MKKIINIPTKFHNCLMWRHTCSLLQVHFCQCKPCQLLQTSLSLKTSRYGLNPNVTSLRISLGFLFKFVNCSYRLWSISNLICLYAIGNWQRRVKRIYLWRDIPGRRLCNLHSRMPTAVTHLNSLSLNRDTVVWMSTILIN